MITHFARVGPPAILALLLTACASAGGPATSVAKVDSTPVVSPTAVADSGGLPATFYPAFREADARARTITYWLQCVPTIAQLRASGRFGAAAAAPRAIYCARTADGVPVGGVYDIDSTYRTVKRLTLVRLDGARPRYTETVDTAHVASEARLARDVTKAITVAWRAKNRPFSTVPVSTAAGIEAWVIPRANKARSYVTGGDVGYTRSADGVLQTLDDRSATWSQLNLTPAGALRIYSSTRDVPAVADLVTARFQTELGRTVVVSTPMAESALVAGLDPETGARHVWKHTAVRR
jgi:hypothetical protein